MKSSLVNVDRILESGLTDVVRSFCEYKNWEVPATFWEFDSFEADLGFFDRLFRKKEAKTACPICGGRARRYRIFVRHCDGGELRELCADPTDSRMAHPRLVMCQAGHIVMQYRYAFSGDCNTTETYVLGDDGAFSLHTQKMHAAG